MGQDQCVKRSTIANTIVALPTGKGRTLVAARVIDHFVNRDDQHVMFIVATSFLENQQAEYCEQHCARKIKAAKLSAMGTETWDAAKWIGCLSRFQVLIGTPKVFWHAIDSGFLNPGQFS